MRSTFMDNPFITEGIKNQLRGYNPYAWDSTYVSECGTKLINKLNDEEISEANQPPPNELNIKNGTADAFMWLVYGLGLSAEKPNRIYRGWKTCTVEDFRELEYTSYFGGDFGISAETAIVEVKFDGDRTFYVHQRLYKPSSTMGMPLAEYILTQIQPPITSKDLMIWDSAKLAMVNELRFGGLKAVPAKKGQGSMAKNISNVQSINIVFTDTSLDLEDEYFNYSYKLDRYSMVTDEVDKSTKDHLLNSLEYCVSYLFGYLKIRFK